MELPPLQEAISEDALQLIPWCLQADRGRPQSRSVVLVPPNVEYVPGTFVDKATEPQGYIIGGPRQMLLPYQRAFKAYPPEPPCQESPKTATLKTQITSPSPQSHSHTIPP